jgi:hypothetical protein
MDTDAMLAKTSNGDLLEIANRDHIASTIALGQELMAIGEIERRQAFREEGATSTAAWMVERLGLSEAEAHQRVRLASRLWDFPKLSKAMCEGEISVDKVRAAVDLATTISERSWPDGPRPIQPDDSDGPSVVDLDADVLEQARQCSVRELVELTRRTRGTTDERAMRDHDQRFARFNAKSRTMTAQFPSEAFVRLRNAIEGEAKRIESDGETPWDQRCADALIRLIDAPHGGSKSSASDPLVVVHVDLALLRGGFGRAELEGLGLISQAAAERLACEARVALAIDDAFGHTMAEGYEKRLPTPAQRREIIRRDRTCRFPGCSNTVFTNVHHILPWAQGGKTDLPNLVLLCNHHHHVVHEGKWQLTGDANGELKFMGPTKRLMTSRPSPLWTRRN